MMGCDPEPHRPSLSHGPISSYLSSALSLEGPMWGHFDLFQHLCSEQMLQWVSPFTQSPKERKREEHVASENGGPEDSEDPGSWLTVCGEQSLVDIWCPFCPRAHLCVLPCLRRVCRWPHSWSLAFPTPCPTLPLHHTVTAWGLSHGEGQSETL